MGYEQERRVLSRCVSWLVTLRLDYCALTYGQSPCQAGGLPYCYYTYPTCRDPAHYAAGSKEYLFSAAEGRPVAGAFPYLADLRTVPTEIRPEDHVTRRARITLEFLDDAPLALANPDKTVSNPETSGSFFRNLIARNPHAAGRPAEIREGFAGLSAADYRLVFRGVIEKMEWEEGKARVVIKDQFKLLEKKIPAVQGHDNVLTSAYSGGSTMAVTRGREFEAPGTVKVEDEYITFTGVSGDQLTGCVPGRFGSAAVSHAAGRRVRQAAVFAEAEDGEGLPPDELFLSLLCRHGGIDPLVMAAVDRGSALTGGITGNQSAVPVDHLENFPESGIVRIDDELIRYRGVSGACLQAVERGAYGTAAADHDAGRLVLILRFTEELGRWMAGTRFRRFVEEATAVKDLVNELRGQCLIHVWQAEDSTIAAKSVAPPFYLERPKEIGDEAHLLHRSTSWAAAEELRVSRVSVHYAPLEADPPAQPAAYAGLLVVVDAEAESPLYFGEIKNRELWANWIYREHEALLLASRLLLRYCRGAATYKFGLELKDDDLKVGDFVRILSQDLVDFSGAPRSALFEVLKKERLSDNRLEFLALDTRLDKRYPVIAPPQLTADYDAAEEEDRERYGWIGNTGNKVGSAGEDGYYIY